MDVEEEVEAEEVEEVSRVLVEAAADSAGEEDAVVEEEEEEVVGVSGKAPAGEVEGEGVEVVAVEE